MTAYPVNFAYDATGGVHHDGFAPSEDEARTIIEAILSEAEGQPTTVEVIRLDEVQAGRAASKAEIERWWADEIDEGWVSTRQVYGGWVAIATGWTC